MRTVSFFEEPREPTPASKIEDRPSGRWVTLQPGAQYWINYRTNPPLESAEIVKETLGINASLLAEVYLGPEYPLLIFDRGSRAQGVKELIIPDSRYIVEDRFLIADQDFMLRAHMRSGTGGKLRSWQGVVEMCVGGPLVFGREYPHDGRFDTSQIPMSVSEKHMAISPDFNDRLYIVDTHSTNLTKVHHHSPHQY